ncbi:MAG: 4-hydroxythreonine-4-phosphate dehydrogenase PdxA [Burkholderiales bacterium]|nr:MAG: 4-hydroxythreonine-4-phosphate dehydrogenase PdxA [Betaproteobacteria bacterium]TAG79082.1 MAG: 4-hydroxythreonine-4-phosphate dehydrogenase PdxA [Burkholderiales bacterium]
MTRFALTMGDPAGVGPEIIVDALCSLDEAFAREVVVFGERTILERAHALSTHPRARALRLDIVETSSDTRFEPGVASAASGLASIAAIEAATRACSEGKFSALITAPINKTALKLAGSPFPGHTEMLAALCGVPHVTMMFASERLNVILVTIHRSLRDAIADISIDSVTRAIEFAHSAKRELGCEGRSPRIAVAGLNPHASEDGLFGDEEQRFIAPAIAICRAKGINASGPYPPDTIFMRAINRGEGGEFDIVVAMTHDHGLIPVKLDGIDRAVNVTLGLPFLRASVDHGTAYDIAWQGKASSKNLQHVLRWVKRTIAE